MKKSSYLKLLLIGSSILCNNVMGSSHTDDPCALPAVRLAKNLVTGDQVDGSPFIIGGAMTPNVVISAIPDNATSMNFSTTSDGFLRSFSYVDAASKTIAGTLVGTQSPTIVNVPFNNETDELFLLQVVTQFHNEITGIAGITLAVTDSNNKTTPYYIGKSFSVDPHPSAFSITNFPAGNGLKGWISGGYGGVLLDSLSFTRFDSEETGGHIMKLPPKRLSLSHSSRVNPGGVNDVIHSIFAGVNTAAQIAQLLMPLLPFMEDNLLDDTTSAAPFLGFPNLLITKAPQPKGAPKESGGNSPPQFVNQDPTPYSISYDGTTITVPARTAEKNGVKKITDGAFWEVPSTSPILCTQNPSKFTLKGPFEAFNAMFMGRGVKIGAMMLGTFATIKESTLSYKQDPDGTVTFSATSIPALINMNMVYSHFNSIDRPGVESVSSITRPPQNTVRDSAGAVSYVFPLDLSLLGTDELFDFDLQFYGQSSN